MLDQCPPVIVVEPPAIVKREINEMIPVIQPPKLFYINLLTDLPQPYILITIKKYPNKTSPDLIQCHKSQ